MANYHQYYKWDCIMVRIEWVDGPDDVSDISMPDHPTGTVPKGETHALVEPANKHIRPWWATEAAVEKYADPVGPFDSAAGFDDTD